MKVIFAGGGTGGHLYPSLAVAEELKNKNVEMLFLISNRGLDSKILMKSGYNYIEQDVSAFKGKGFLAKIKSILKLIKCVFADFRVIKKGDKVFITGGFASAPAAIVAKIKGCKIYLHEQNSVMGLVNRTVSGFCEKVFLSFENTKKAKGKTLVTGNPVRKIFMETSKKEGWDGKLLILGGSQGSRKINNIIASSIDFIVAEGFSITHQTGEGLYRETITAYGYAARRYASKLTVLAYIDRPSEFISKADIVVGRAGSGTIFELSACGAPAIYIPFKAASDNHQYYNAKAVEEKGGATILNEDEANPEKFMEALKFMKNNIEDFRRNLRSRPPMDSVKIIVKEMGFE